MLYSLNHRFIPAAVWAALLALCLSACGAGDTSGLESPEPKSYEYQYEGWCYRWVPQGQADLNLAMRQCQQKVKERQQYIKAALGPAYEKGPTAWSMESCLQVLGWEHCPPED